MSIGYGPTSAARSWNSILDSLLASKPNSPYWLLMKPARPAPLALRRPRFIETTPSLIMVLSIQSSDGLRPRAVIAQRNDVGAHDHWSFWVIASAFRL